MPLVGIEPAVKPAVELNTNKKIIIMATPMTLKEKKFLRLIERFKDKAEIVSMPCARLVEFVEESRFDSDELMEYLEDKYKNINKEDIGAVVLGCTHFPFVRDKIQKVVGEGIPVIDGSLGTCKELRRRLKKADLLNDSNTKGEVTIINSLEEEKIINLCNMLLYSK